jgi:4-oxalocrotonate tautomerase
MPVITLEGSTLGREQKLELIRQLTATASEITRIPPQFFTVILREHEDIDLGVGGESVEVVKAKHRQSQA